MRRRLKIRLLSAALFLLTVMFCRAGSLCCRAAEERNRFDIEAYGKVDVAAECTHVTVSVSNHGENINALVRLRVDTDYGCDAAYEKEAALPAGSKKDVELVIPADTLKMVEKNYCTLNVGIYSGRKLLQETSVNPQDVFPDMKSADLTTALLSDSPNDLYWLDNGGDSVYAGGRDRFIALTEIDADFSAQDLVNNRFLVIDDFDTSTLTAQQIRDIEDWVFAGGSLILGTGSRPQTMAGFDESFLDAKALETDENIKMTLIDYGSGHNQLYGGESFRIREYGSGAMMLFQYGLSDIGKTDPDDTGIFMDVNIQEEAGNFIHSVFSGLSDFTMTDYQEPDPIISSDYEFKEIFSNIEQKISLRFGWLKILVWIYCIFIGPLMYLILKAGDKREKVWICIPLTALLFVGIVYLAGFSNKVSGMHLSALSISAADGRGNTHTYISGYNSGNREWGFKLGEDYYTATTDIRGYYSGDSASVTVRQETEGTYISADPTGSFDSFRFCAYAKNREKGSLTFDWDEGSFDMTGILKNQTGHDLYYCLLIDGDDAILYKDIADGASISVPDARHVEKDNLKISSSDDLKSLIYSFERDKKYEQARYAAGIYLALRDLDEKEKGRCLIGIAKDEMPVLSGQDADVSLSCLYSEW